MKEIDVTKIFHFLVSRKRERERENPSLCRNKDEREKEGRLMRDPSVETRKL